MSVYFCSSFSQQRKRKKPTFLYGKYKLHFASLMKGKYYLICAEFLMLLFCAYISELLYV